MAVGALVDGGASSATFFLPPHAASDRPRAARRVKLENICFMSVDPRFCCQLRVTNCNHGNKGGQAESGSYALYRCHVCGHYPRCQHQWADNSPQSTVTCDWVTVTMLDGSLGQVPLPSKSEQPAHWINSQSPAQGLRRDQSTTRPPPPPNIRQP